MLRHLVPFLLVGALTAAETTAPVVTGTLEPLTGVRIDGTGLVLGVITRGYSGRNAFSLVVTRDEGQKSVAVAVLRIRDDEGKMMPQPSEIAIPLAELGLRRGDALRVVNPLIVDDL